MRTLVAVLGLARPSVGHKVTSMAYLAYQRVFLCTAQQRKVGTSRLRWEKMRRPVQHLRRWQVMTMQGQVACQVRQAMTC